jgi:hypothetical protein
MPLHHARGRTARTCRGVLGAVFTHAISDLTKQPVVLSPRIAVIGLAFAVVIGVVFGFYPAVKAARLRRCQSLMTTWRSSPQRTRTPPSVSAPTLAFSDQFIHSVLFPETLPIRGQAGAQRLPERRISECASLAVAYAVNLHGASGSSPVACKPPSSATGRDSKGSPSRRETPRLWPAP